MRILSYVDLEGPISRSGIATAADNHRRALKDHPVEVMSDGVTMRRLRSIMPGTPPDVDLVHTHLFGPGSILLAAIARRNGLPLVCHAHVTKEDFRDSFRGSRVLDTPLGWYLRRWYSVADLVLTPSEYTKSVLKEYPVDARIEVISNGIDLDAFEDVESFRDEYRSRYDLDGTVVFTIGNVFERKGLTTFCRVAERCPDLEFVWFGQYETGPHASRTVKRWVNDPPDNVTFTGWVPEKRGAFAAGDIFFFPTYVENQGIAVLEAMACGLPMVLRDIPVFGEYTTDGEDCLRADGLESFVDAIERLVANPDDAARLGENATEAVQAHRLEAVGAQLFEYYRSVLRNNE